MRVGVFGAVVSAVQIDVDDAMPEIVVAIRVERVGAGEPRAVDERVDRAELADDGRDAVAHGPRVGDVAGEAQVGRVLVQRVE